MENLKCLKCQQLNYTPVWNIHPIHNTERRMVLNCLKLTNKRTQILQSLWITSDRLNMKTFAISQKHVGFPFLMFEFLLHLHHFTQQVWPACVSAFRSIILRINWFNDSKFRKSSVSLINTTNSAVVTTSVQQYNLNKPTAAFIPERLTHSHSRFSPVMQL